MVKEGKYLLTDDNDEACQLRGIFTETNFTHVNQQVQKSVVDLFGEGENDANSSNIYFTGSLEKMNVLFFNNSWTYAHEDVLKLPSDN